MWRPGIAEILINMGFSVSGSDKNMTEITERLKKLGAKIYKGHSANNVKDVDVEIKKGDCIGQGIFEKYLVADDDIAEGERKGGFGSTTNK